MAVERYYYEVFGATMRVERQFGQWQLYRVSAEGKSGLIRDFSIPSELSVEELEVFLGDMFHEHATTAHNGVIRLSRNTRKLEVTKETGNEKN